MNKANTIFEDLAHKKISRVFWQYALPAVVGMIVNTLYNIIDGVFIGHWVGKDALSGLGIILPVMNIAAAIGVLIGAGSASRLSISLGENDHEMTEKIAGTSLILTLLLSGSVLTLLFLFLKPVLMFAGASEVNYPYARDFLLIFLPGSLFLTLCFNFNNLMRASGYPLKAMITLLISVVANIILAPIFILYLNWGMKGAATATTISMAISCFFVMLHFLNKNSVVRLKLVNIRLRLKIAKSIIIIGLPQALIQITASAVVILINYQLHYYAPLEGIIGDDVIAAFSNANRLIMLIIMIVIGLTQGMQPIVGYNYGAKNMLRVKEILFYTIKVATCVTTLGFILSFCIPDVLVKIFSPDKSIIVLSATALRDITLAYILVGFQIVTVSFFQCIGMAKQSIFLSLSRQVFFLIPALLIVPKIWGLSGVWLACPIADLLATSISGLLLFNQFSMYKKRKLYKKRV